MNNFTAMLFIIALMCSGCGTIIGHDDNEDSINNGVYRGVRNDYHWVADAVPETEMGTPIYCLDMPFSLVADTICLPYDAIVCMQNPNTEDSQAK